MSWPFATTTGDQVPTPDPKAAHDDLPRYAPAFTQTDTDVALLRLVQNQVVKGMSSLGARTQLVRAGYSGSMVESAMRLHVKNKTLHLQLDPNTDAPFANGNPWLSIPRASDEEGELRVVNPPKNTKPSVTQAEVDEALLRIVKNAGPAGIAYLDVYSSLLGIYNTAHVAHTVSIVISKAIADRKLFVVYDPNSVKSIETARLRLAQRNPFLKDRHVTTETQAMNPSSAAQGSASRRANTRSAWYKSNILPWAIVAISGAVVLYSYLASVFPRFMP